MEEERKKREEEERKRKEEEERLRLLAQESLNYDDINKLIQSFNAEMYSGETQNPLICDRICLTLKMLNEFGNKLILRGLRHGIKTPEDQQKYEQLLAKAKENVEQEEQE